MRETGQLPGDDAHRLGRIVPGIDPIPVALPAGREGEPPGTLSRDAIKLIVRMASRDSS